MLAGFYQKIWSEAYRQNDLNINALLETDPKALILDVGCGDGQKTVKFMQKTRSKNATGIDGQTKRLLAAKKRGIKTTVVDLEKKWPFKKNAFDVVVSNQTIEHLANLDNFIQETKRVLKPGGYAVISTENLASWHNIFSLLLGFQPFSTHLIAKVHIGNPLSPHYGEKTLTWSAKDNSGIDDSAYPHLKVPTYFSLIKIFQEYGFKFEKGLGSGYYPLFSLLSRVACKIDPYHAHFITAKFRKPR
jgi:methionine biosynthesis protein MetW